MLEAGVYAMPTEMTLGGGRETRLTEERLRGKSLLQAGVDAMPTVMTWVGVGSRSGCAANNLKLKLQVW